MAEISPRADERASTYRAAGVDLAAGERAVELIKRVARATYGPRVLGEIGAFSGLFRLGQGYRDPVLVSSTDGVGTKLKIAIALGRFDTIGRDLVAHCVDDILTAGAEPLFFLDYIAMGRLDPEQVAQLVAGMAEECRANGCALIGGETAEMPDLYRPGEFDLAGFVVGVVEREALVDGSKIEPGDVAWGLPSSGLHTNGYSLARRILGDLPLDHAPPELGRPLGDALLEPHRSYLAPTRPLLEAGLVRGMAHVTGGGIPGNAGRMVPEHLAIELQWGTWPVPPIFDFLQRRGRIAFDEMVRVFNMGLGWIFVAPESASTRVRGDVPEALAVGRIVPRASANSADRVRIVGAPR